MPFSAEASCALQNADKQARVIKEAAFIDVLKVLSQEVDVRGNVQMITLKPIFSYKLGSELSLKVPIQISFDTEVLTSCDYRPRGNGTLFEGILFIDKDSSLRLGNKSDMALGHNWNNLRQNIFYVP